MAEFARFLGFPAPVYQRYEKGRIPSAENLSVIAQKCSVSTDWLLSNREPCPESTGHGQTPMVAREPRAEYGTPPTPVCRFPSDCDLQKEITSMKTEMSAMTKQMNDIRLLLVSLLADERTRAADPPAGAVDQQAG